MPSPSNPLKFIPGKGYSQLAKNLKAGFSRLEDLIRHQATEMIQEFGKMINVHILENKDRANYGEFLFDQLEKDTGKDKQTLRKIAKFARLYPIVVTSRQLTWGHYQRLIGISNEKERKKIEKKAVEKGGILAILEDF